MDNAIELADEIDRILLQLVSGEIKPAKIPMRPWKKAADVLRELAPDAARYRALRDPPKRGDAYCAWLTNEGGCITRAGDNEGPLTGESLDAKADMQVARKEWERPTPTQESK